VVYDVNRDIYIYILYIYVYIYISIYIYIYIYILKMSHNGMAYVKLLSDSNKIFGV
jgi:hypothetical protein